MGLTQRSLGQRLGVSQSEVSRWERSALERVPVAAVERWAAMVGAHLALSLVVDGEKPMTDRRHAAIQARLTTMLREVGWIVENEVSFNHFGDRGRIDILAFHPGRRIVLVIEVKSGIDDVQELLGRLDVKRRIGAPVAAERGWQLAATVPMIAIADARTARRRVDGHAPLFARYALRARAATAWLRQPRPPAPAGILIFLKG